MSETTGAVRAAYEAGAASWAAGPERVYGRFADALVGASPFDLAGRRVLDLGAGTGVASRALLASGAEPVGVDIPWHMLRQRDDERPPGERRALAEEAVEAAGRSLPAECAILVLVARVP